MSLIQSLGQERKKKAVILFLIFIPKTTEDYRNKTDKAVASSRKTKELMVDI